MYTILIRSVIGYISRLIHNKDVVIFKYNRPENGIFVFFKLVKVYNKYVVVPLRM
jgi:hypothetical protein